jgi:serine/threonine protein phosphatase PrpC/ribosomal protein L37E
MEDRFCEECGAHLGGPGKEPAALCTKCGAGADEIDEDGYCTACGFRREPPLRDRFERVVSPVFAGITDRGIRHHRNEDFFAMDTVRESHVIVVCDGVSSTSDADRASETATDAIFRALLQSERLTEALALGQSAVAGLTGDAATTAVAAVVRGRKAEIAWMGDSRAYWIAREDSKQLTRDDSWLNEVVESGEMPAEDAVKSPQAHAITRWLGADAEPDESVERIVEFEAPGEGYLLVCSDGLWNYVPDAAAMADLVYAESGEAVDIARRLVDFANSKGGQDNITAVLLAL